MRYRPWGPVEWVLSLSSKKEWCFIGTIGTEERSLAGWTYINRLCSPGKKLFALVHDVKSIKYADATESALDKQKGKYLSNGGCTQEIEEMELLSELFVVQKFAEQAFDQESVILDVSSFPKRFFFPILRGLVNSDNVKNLLVIYTSPASYPADAPLYEDIDEWRNLPGFGGAAAATELWIVSVGFLVESLRRYIGGNPDSDMKLLVPFPAPLPVLRRTWESVATLERGLSPDRFEKFRVEPLDISSAFDRICSLAGQPAQPIAFAPYGPKPTSVAMCLYAIQRDSSVHYAQPTVYHPSYSKGIQDDDPAKAVTAYWIKHDGENLFAV